MSLPMKMPPGMPPISHIARPWGSFRQYAHNMPVTVSLMTVARGQRLSLQSHENRAELWIALDDGALVQVGDDIFEANAGDEIWIPAGEKHRLSSRDGLVRVLEVAFGDWRQDDITRYEDDYARQDPRLERATAQNASSDTRTSADTNSKPPS